MENQNEDLIPVRVQTNDLFISNKSLEDQVFYFINKLNKEVFRIKGTTLGENMLKNRNIIQPNFQFNYNKRLIVFDSGDFSNENKLLNTRMFIIDFKGNILLDLKNCYMNTNLFFSNQHFIYFYKEFKETNFFRKLCFLKDNLEIIETPYSRFESKLLNGFLVSKKVNDKKEYAIYDKDFELLLNDLNIEDLDLRTLLNK